MFGGAGRRAAEIVVGLFALLGFVCVPLGKKTGFEHLLAIATTDAMRSAAADLSGTVVRARSQLAEAIWPSRSDARERSPSPRLSAEPRPALPRLGR